MEHSLLKHIIEGKMDERT